MTDLINTNTKKISDLKSILTSLREELNSGQISKTQFLLNAAKAYLGGQMPLRTLALLKTIEKRNFIPDQSIQYDLLKNDIKNFPPLPYQLCSLNMIVKNEEHNITEALDSVDSIMDEIVICDTGSTDRTIELAEQYGVTIIHDHWRNDFSRARNKAIEASACDWILWMDADDRLEQTSAEPLRKLWREATPQAATFCIVNDRENDTAIEFLQVRLFPRQPGMRFEQRIHEQIMYSAAREKIPFSKHLRIRIDHKGYKDPETHRKKAARNKPLIISELEDHPDDPTLQLSLGDCLTALDEIEEAKELFHKVTLNNSAWEKNSDVFIQAHLNLANIFIQQNDIHNAKRYLLRSLYLDKSRIEAYFALARIYLNEGDDKKAAAYFMKSSRITPPLRMTAVDNLKIRLESIYNLIELLIKWKRYSEVEHILLPAIKTYPMVPQYYTQMGKALLEQDKIREAAHYFTLGINISPTNNDDAYKGMAKIYTLLGDKITAEEYLQNIAS